MLRCAMDVLGDLLAQPTPRRMLHVGTFLFLLWAFAGLLPVLAAFAVSQRALDVCVTAISRRTGWSAARSLIAVLALMGAALFAVGAASWNLVHGLALEAQTYLPDLAQELRTNELVVRAVEVFGGGDELAAEAAGHAVGAVHDVGIEAVHVAVGFFLALAYLAERETTDAAVAAIDPRSTLGTLLRWTDHVGDGLAITVQLQVIVALCNSVLTLPVMLALGIPHPVTVLAVIFLLALVPVVGNLISGLMLVALAWPAWGWVAVAVFVTLTFALGKIEGFYLTPRLASRHVRLPGFVLATSLVLWEEALGFVGFFLSFPALYVALRIHHELRDGAPGRAPDQGL